MNDNEREFTAKVEIVVRAHSEMGARALIRLVLLSASKPPRDFSIVSVEEAAGPTPPPEKGP